MKGQNEASSLEDLQRELGMEKWKSGKFMGPRRRIDVVDFACHIE